MVCPRLAALEIAQGDLCGLHFGVAEHPRELEDFTAILQPTAGECVPEGVWTHAHTVVDQRVRQCARALGSLHCAAWERLGNQGTHAALARC